MQKHQGENDMVAGVALGKIQIFPYNKICKRKERQPQHMFEKKLATLIFIKCTLCVILFSFGYC